MSWLYGQTWLWYLIAFAVGVLLAWLFLVLPQQRRLAAARPQPSGGAAGDEKPAAVAAPVAEPAVDDAVTERFPAVDPALSTLDAGFSTGRHAADADAAAVTTELPVITERTPTPAGGIAAAALGAAGLAPVKPAPEPPANDDPTTAFPVVAAERDEPVAQAGAERPADDATAVIERADPGAAADATTAIERPDTERSDTERSDTERSDTERPEPAEEPAAVAESAATDVDEPAPAAEAEVAAPAAEEATATPETEAPTTEAPTTEAPTTEALTSGAPEAESTSTESTSTESTEGSSTPSGTSALTIAGAATATTHVTAVPEPFGPGSAGPSPDGTPPGPEFPIKGNAGSKLYHTPESPYYGRTKAEAYFRSPADAEAAGFTAWTRKKPRPGAQAVASAVAVADAPSYEPGPYPGSAKPAADGTAPTPEFTIKGNADSMLYHTPESPYYGRTRAEAWFGSTEAAEAAGFTAWRRR
ncbi:hypothetical protein WEH80_33400 [Actinomycetes bacterium KLBMP 9759]